MKSRLHWLCAWHCTLKFLRPEGSWEDLRSRLEGPLLRRLSRQWVDQGTRMRSITPKKYKYTDFYICLIFFLLSNVILYKIDSSCCWFVGNPLISVDCLIDFMVFSIAIDGLEMIEWGMLCSLKRVWLISYNVTVVENSICQFSWLTVMWVWLSTECLPVWVIDCNVTVVVNSMFAYLVDWLRTACANLIDWLRTACVPRLVDGKERGVRVHGDSSLQRQLHLHPCAPPPCHSPPHQQG